MLKIVICWVCKDDFSVSNAKSRLCSPECKTKAPLLRRKFKRVRG